MSPHVRRTNIVSPREVLSLLRMKAACREGGLFLGIGPAVRNSIPQRAIAGVDERFLHWLLFGLIMATLVAGVMAAGTAWMTVL